MQPETNAEKVKQQGQMGSSEVDRILGMMEANQARDALKEHG